MNTKTEIARRGKAAGWTPEADEIARLLIRNAKLLAALELALPLIGPCLYSGKKADCACQTCALQHAISSAH